jgi:alginate O-acetyltransferase complex protein AlgI
LGGSKAGMIVKIRNTFIIFIVSGFWHGANWTFIVWGLLNAIYFLPLLLLNRNRINTDTVAYGRMLPNFMEFFQMATTFLLVTLAWVFFRADSISHALNYFSKMFSATLFSSPLKDIWAINTGYHIVYLSTMVLLLIIVEWAQRNKKHGLEFNDSQIARPLRWTIYYVLILCCFLMNGVQQDFIYFQF